MIKRKLYYNKNIIKINNNKIIRKYIKTTNTMNKKVTNIDKENKEDKIEEPNKVNVMVIN